MDFDCKVLCDAVDEAFMKMHLPLLDRATVRLIVEIAGDCYDLGYKAGQADKHVRELNGETKES